MQGEPDIERLFTSISINVKELRDGLARLSWLSDDILAVMPHLAKKPLDDRAAVTTLAISAKLQDLILNLKLPLNDARSIRNKINGFLSS